MKEFKFPKLAYNWLSALGAIMAVMAVLVMTFLYLVDVFARETNPYLGIFLYMILPFFLVLGLLLIPVGMYRRWKAIRKYGEEAYPAWPYVDLNERRHRNAFFVFLFGTFFFVIVSAVGSYQAYHYTESVTFCGKTCHTVMKPEYTAYQNSPHARVACVGCHVGPGADWFAKSKLSGLYQVYATMADVFPRPIPTPIENLRPARETCEQCHWPEKFFGMQQRQFDHYQYDEANSPWRISMLVKTGGSDPRTGQVAGIHWHMFIGTRVEYISRDEERLDIPWVRATDLRTGKATVYRNVDEPPTDEEISMTAARVVDCVDCHNRPSHIYKSPDYAIDRLILTKMIDRKLPEIKRIAVEAMAEIYETEKDGLKAIEEAINSFYREDFPDIHEDKKAAIQLAISETQRSFSENIFPEMKARWEHYFDNLGHFINVGCMRCHDGNHADDEGRIISHDCDACHIIISQGRNEGVAYSSFEEGLRFEHPVDIDEAWLEMGCFECHTGSAP